MKKIPTLFVRDQTTKRVTNQVTPGLEFVLSGQCTPTVKIDGTCCLVRDGKFYRRYDAKAGRTPPANFEPAQPEPDPITGHFPGWVPVGDGPEDKWHREALEYTESHMTLHNSTYELIGPKVQSNLYKMPNHILEEHGTELILNSLSYTFDDLASYFYRTWFEGIVWWFNSAPVCKLKRSDFGFSWPCVDLDAARPNTTYSRRLKQPDASKPPAEYLDTEFGGESGIAGMFSTRIITAEEVNRLAAKYYERYGSPSMKVNAQPFIRTTLILPEEKIE